MGNGKWEREHRYSASDAQKLATVIGQVREIGRFRDGDEREPLVVYTLNGETGLRVVIVQENEESLVLTPNELRWLISVIHADGKWEEHRD